MVACEHETLILSIIKKYYCTCTIVFDLIKQTCSYTCKHTLGTFGNVYTHLQSILVMLFSQSITCIYVEHSGSVGRAFIDWGSKDC